MAPAWPDCRYYRPGLAHAKVSHGSMVDIVDNCQVKVTCYFTEFIVVVDETLLDDEVVCES